jgi:probable F420-dependent oxidoreductase
VLPSPRVAPSPMEPTDPILDPFVHLAYIAAVTTHMDLATGIIILPQRNPLVLAKQAASLDVLSGGRLVLGIGAGYLEPEMNAIGVTLAERGSRTEEYLDAMAALWTQAAPEYHGRHVDFAGIDAHPRPVQPGGPRIVVGGRSDAAHDRAVARGHGWYGFFQSPEATSEQLAFLKAAAIRTKRPDRLGRLEISITPARRLDRATVDAYAELGIDRLVVYPLPLRNEDDIAAFLEEQAALVQATR